MILADTSVWIDYFNGIATAETDLLDQALAQDVVAMGDLILLEILQGFRSERHYHSAKKHLLALAPFAMLSPALAIRAAENYRMLRKQGITIRKTADAIIATFCIEHRIPLLYSDRDFIPFVEHLGLQSASAQA